MFSVYLKDKKDNYNLHCVTIDELHANNYINEIGKRRHEALLLEISAGDDTPLVLTATDLEALKGKFEGINNNEDELLHNADGSVSSL